MHFGGGAKGALTLALALALLVITLLSSTHTSLVLAQQTLAGTNWNVQAYNDGYGNKSSVVPGSQPTLNFGTDGTVSGDTGCNNFSGSYTVSGSAITFGAMATTLRACVDPSVSAQEQAYLAALANTTGYQLSGDQLVLTDASGYRQVVLSAASNSLAGTAWRVISINNGNQAVTSVVTGSGMTLALGQDGVASGSTGCNDYRALYISDTSSLSFGPVIATRRACSETLANQEQWFLAALSASSTYTLTGNSLTVRDGDGAIQFTATTATVVPLPAPSP
jgi:heat shock protein HslJ